MFSITPYKSAGPIQIGMSIDDLVEAAGQPQESSKNRRGELEFRYSGLSVRLNPNTKKVVEVGILPSPDVVLNGVKIFDSPNAINRLIEMDGNPYEYLGFLVLINLGITLTGFHDSDESQKAMTVFEEGRWDHLRSHFKKLSS